IIFLQTPSVVGYKRKLLRHSLFLKHPFIAVNLMPHCFTVKSHKLPLFCQIIMHPQNLSVPVSPDIDTNDNSSCRKYHSSNNYDNHRHPEFFVMLGQHSNKRTSDPQQGENQPHLFML